MKLLLKFKYLFFLVFIVGLIEVFLNVFSSYYLGKILDSKDESISDILIIILYILLIFTSAIIFTYIYRSLFAYFSNKLTISYKAEKSKNISQFSLNKFKSKNLGEYSAFYVRNAEMVVDKNSLVYIDFLRGFFIVAISLGFIASLNYLLAIWAFLASLVAFGAPLLLKKFYSKINIKLVELNNNYSNNVNLLLNAFKTFFIFKKVDIFLEKMNNETKKQGYGEMKNNILIFLFNSINAFVSICIQVFIISITVFYYKWDFVPLGSIIVMMTLQQLLINGVSQSVHSFLQIISSLKVKENIDTEFAVVHNDNPLRAISSNIIEVRNLKKNFQDNIILSIPSLKIIKNEKIAIIGPSGSGKSTLMSMVANLDNEYEGQITFDGTNFKQEQPNRVFDNAIYVEQNSFIFNDTIKNNILMNETFDQNKWNNIIKITKLEKLINDKENNENFVISENGSNVSGGEKQRIALARALYADPQILILDEYTNQLELKSAIEIESNILDLNKTIVWISHKIQKEIFLKLDKIYEVSDKKLLDKTSEFKA